LLSKQNSALRAARDLLLPKLISGEIDFSRAEAAFAEAAE
jgi:type I restriction enzyme S subunit